MQTTDSLITQGVDESNPLAEIVVALGDQVQHLATLVRELQEREQWYLRQRVATDAQRLAILRQVEMPTLLDRIREGGA